MTDFSKELNDKEEQITEKDVSGTLNSVGVIEDLQISTAKKYPRDLKTVLKNILFLATQDKETADNCFYSVIRDGKTIRGASIRLAEIITTCYGNIRASSKIISNDGKFVTAQGMCWDLENNTAFSIEVVRKITDDYGRPLTDDLVAIASNVASSVALRNSIFKVVPMAITAKIQEEIRKVIMGEAKDFESIRKSAVEYFTQKGVAEKNILSLFNKKSSEDLTRDDVFDLRGIATAIKEGDTTIERAFSLSSKGNAIGKASRMLSDAPITPIPEMNHDNEKEETENKEERKEEDGELKKTEILGDAEKMNELIEQGKKNKVRRKRSNAK